MNGQLLPANHQMYAAFDVAKQRLAAEKEAGIVIVNRGRKLYYVSGIRSITRASGPDYQVS